MSSGSKGQITRTMDDVDQQALTYSEIKALCTGGELEEKSARMQEFSDILHQEAQSRGDDKPMTYYFSMAKTMSIKPPESGDIPKQKELDAPDKKKPDISDGE